MLYPAVVDIGILSLVVHQSPDVAWQLLWIDGQSMLWSGLLATATERIGRDRPFVPLCAEDPDIDGECLIPSTRSRSFISGHLTMAATGASLTCTHALNLGLYGGPESAALVCSTAFAGVAVVATSRLLADRHYATDLFAAAMVGVTSGMVLPQLMHFGWDVDPKEGGAALVTPWVQPDAFGLSLSWQSRATATMP
jgi:membrane-associated phospholipid phosphatase